jgi:hypothetical protein
MAARQQAELIGEPAAVRIGNHARPVRSGCTAVGRVMCHVRCSQADEVHHQAILLIGEADAHRPALIVHDDVVRPGGAAIVAPAHDAGEGVVVESGDDHVHFVERVHAVPVIRKSKIHDLGPVLSAVRCFPDLAQLGRRIADLRVGEREIVNDGAGQRRLESPRVGGRAERVVRLRSGGDTWPIRREFLLRPLHGRAMRNVPDRRSGFRCGSG